MKHFLLVQILVILLLTGCGMESIRFSGESENWKGEYAANISEARENGEYRFGYKNAERGMVFESLEITIDEGGGEINQRMDEHRGATIKVSSSCSGCAVNDTDDPIEVTIEWDGENKETFLLQSD